ncbi:sugar transferase [Vibrio breoganii]|uniref:sugar transferase n=1 Tax=Vibrio breoganii TaxID=553239 RepID=UPI0021C4C82D|nr:sugar transferase [Vibrio breoganii]MDN3715928.1 sugar transferase [Vibrio breoganii]
MIRLLDILLSFFGLLFLWPVMLVVLLIGYFDTGHPVFIQIRLGQDRRPFKLIKFRTMTVETKSVASHLASDASITKVGKFLRKTKLDELPQLMNVFRGDMSIVGPRPNLENQFELIEVRSKLKVYDVRPGITGLAQVKNVDMSTPLELARLDKEMIEKTSVRNYFNYILLTLTGAGQGDTISK